MAYEIIKRRWVVASGKKTQEEVDQMPLNYNVQAVLIEIRNNYIQYLANDVYVKQLNKDYSTYLEELNHNINHYTERQQRNLRHRIKQIEDQLEHPTFYSTTLYAFENLRRKDGDPDYNPFPKIFSNGSGYGLFLKMHENFVDRKYYNADYSFLYYALDEDNYLVCKGTEWIKWLGEKYNIHFDRIDSRYKQNHDKTKLYNAIKEQYT